MIEVGKKVRIKNLYSLGEEEYHDEPGIISDMLKYSGKIMTIKKIHKSPTPNGIYFSLKEDCGGWFWADWMFDVIPNFTEESIYE